MDDINHWHGSGTILNDCTITELPNQKCVATFRLKVNEVATTRVGEKIKLKNVVLKIVAWKSLAEHARLHGKKGKRVVCHGRIHLSEWTGRTGEPSCAWEIHLTKKIQLIDDWIDSLPSPAPLTPKLYPD